MCIYIIYVYMDVCVRACVCVEMPALQAGINMNKYVYMHLSIYIFIHL